MRATIASTRREPESAGSRGFTLIELLIIQVVISILAALTIPLYTALGDRARAVAQEGAPVATLAETQVTASVPSTRTDASGGFSFSATMDLTVTLVLPADDKHYNLVSTLSFPNQAAAAITIATTTRIVPGVSYNDDEFSPIWDVAIRMHERQLRAKSVSLSGRLDHHRERGTDDDD